MTKAATFSDEQAALRWIDKTERALSRPGAVEAEVARRSALTVGGAIKRYTAERQKAIGRTKAQVLQAILSYDIAEIACSDLRSADIVTFARELSANRQSSTVANYLSHLSAVLRLVRAAWGADTDDSVMRTAQTACHDLGLTGKSKRRTRRPTLNELALLMRHFVDRSRRRNALPMHVVTAFAIYSTRRQEEIVSIRWVDLEPGRVLVRDMKHPGEKVGNDVWCELPPEAERIIAAAPRTSERIFPYTTDAVSAAFTRACKFLGIADLHFHDMRHEGVSRLFEMGRTLPLTASVSGHRSWSSLQRYTHIQVTGDRFAGWSWLEVVAPPPTVTISVMSRRSGNS